MERKKGKSVEFTVDGQKQTTSWEREIRAVHAANPISDFTDTPVCTPRYGSHAEENTRG